MTDTQDKINLVTARAFITTILSDACKFDGGLLGSFNKDIFLAGKLIPDSIFAYLPSIYVSAVIAKFISSCS